MVTARNIDTQTKFLIINEKRKRKKRSWRGIKLKIFNRFYTIQSSSVFMILTNITGYIILKLMLNFRIINIRLQEISELFFRKNVCVCFQNDTM